MNSTSTRLSVRVDAALSTVRIALATRPPLPISRPRSSGPTVTSRTRFPFSSTSVTCTESGSSTSARQTNSTSSRINWSAPQPSGAAGLDALGPEQPGDGTGRLRAVAEPVLGALYVDHDRRRISLRVVVADRLDRPPVPRRTAVRDDDSPDRVLLRTHPRQPDSYGHAAADFTYPA